jgi:hypothetical protein
MNDRALFILLLLLALGLWANFLFPRTSLALAQESRGYTLQSVYNKLVVVQSDLAALKRQVDEVKNGMTEIATGTCRNPKIC